MANIFFCCWGKRNSIDAGDAQVKGGGPNTPPQSSETGAQDKEGSVSAQGKAGENGSAAKSPVNIVVDSSELGDFSAVSRETEILRSYRKPPPPKNRARQSRAPRALLKSSTENLDIFQEVSEDSHSLSLGVPTTTEVSATRGGVPTTTEVSATRGDRPSSEGAERDSADSSPLLRSRLLNGLDGDVPKREDVRSSMLADIEQTLAALHAKEEQEASDAEKGSKDELCVQETVISVSSQPTSRLAADGGVAERDVSPARPSPRTQSPLLKHKVGPPVSPKPNIRKKILTTQRASDDDADTKKEEGESSTSKADLEPLPKLTSPEVTTADKQNGVTEKAESQGGTNVTAAATAAVVSPGVKDESSKKQLEDSSENGGELSPSKDQTPTSTTAEPEKSQVSEKDDTTTGSEAESGKPQQPQTDNASSRPSSSYDNCKEAEKEKKNGSDNTSARPSSAYDNCNTAAEEGENPISSPNAGDESAKNQPAVVVNTDDASDEGTLSSEKPSEQPGTESEAAKPSQNGSSAEAGGKDNGNDSDSSKHDPQKKGPPRQDSTEEAGGKGKTSRIPVRAGSKPRSSPPKAEQQEESGN